LVALREAAIKRERQFDLFQRYALSEVSFQSGAAGMALNILALCLLVSPDTPHTMQDV